ncbi:hypothetical protein MSG28_011731 [Choristoneura fumiferana]|uniref:Uncharacterized protein n=1 Tax=Choristoneura fumiferana TaxID=7141 RepID=A0ACC0KM91_CHOFU|nr:hypothetical protein MSG28_011731 [Choristoneura fumiferana]
MYLVCASFFAGGWCGRRLTSSNTGRRRPLDFSRLFNSMSAVTAAEVLRSQRQLVRCRPLQEATLESRNKAKKCAEFLQPYRQRPETCTALARRLVSGALGVRLSTARQERAEERRLITLAREKKRQAALHKEAAWDGSLANQSVADT